MPKRNHSDLQDYPTFDVIANGTHYTVHDVIEWKPLVFSFNNTPETNTYVIQFICYHEDLTIRCADESEQIGIIKALSEIY